MAVSACNLRAGRDDDDDDEETRERTTCLFSLLGWIGRSTLTAPPTSLAFRSAVSWYTGCFSGARGGVRKIAKQLRTLSLSLSLALSLSKIFFSSGREIVLSGFPGFFSFLFFLSPVLTVAHQEYLKSAAFFCFLRNRWRGIVDL